MKTKMKTLRKQATIAGVTLHWTETLDGYIVGATCRRCGEQWMVRDNSTCDGAWAKCQGCNEYYGMDRIAWARSIGVWIAWARSIGV